MTDHTNAHSHDDDGFDAPSVTTRYVAPDLQLPLPPTYCWDPRQQSVVLVDPGIDAAPVMTADLIDDIRAKMRFSPENRARWEADATSRLGVREVGDYVGEGCTKQERLGEEGHGQSPNPVGPRFGEAGRSSGSDFASPSDRAAGGATPRHDGWTPQRRRRFIELIADGNTVKDACAFLALSTASAYALRRRADGAAFALGWRAAGLLARDRIADGLLQRALEGQTDTVTRADGSTVTRHRFDNRLGLTMLARLDALARAGSDDLDAAPARGVAGAFDGFLDLIEAGGDAGAAVAYVAGLDVPEGVGPSDRQLRQLRLEQEAEAHAADAAQDAADDAAAWGGVAGDGERGDGDGGEHGGGSDSPGDRVWYDMEEGWLTDFATPPGQTPTVVQGEPGTPEFARTLVDDELAAVARWLTPADEEEAERAGWFAAAAAGLMDEDVPGDGAGDRPGDGPRDGADDGESDAPDAAAAPPAAPPTGMEHRAAPAVDRAITQMGKGSDDGQA